MLQSNTMYNRVTKLLLSNTTSSNTTSLNFRFLRNCRRNYPIYHTCMRLLINSFINRCIHPHLHTYLPIYLPTSLPPYLPTSLPPSLPPYLPLSLPSYTSICCIYRYINTSLHLNIACRHTDAQANISTHAHASGCYGLYCTVI